jgi:predicted metalloprotease with PDZ domain
MMQELEDLRRSFERTGRFGIALACAPSCSKLVMDGFEYWKYDAPPTIAEVRNNSPAQRTGLQVGDIVIAIDGWALTTDEGAQRFVRSATDSTSIALTIRRNGQDLRFVLSASPGRGGGGGRGGARGRGGPPQ